MDPAPAQVHGKRMITSPSTHLTTDILKLRRSDVEKAATPLPVLKNEKSVRAKRKNL
jgi:hypothetical protein